MPFYDFEKQDGSVVTEFRKVADRDVLPPDCTGRLPPCRISTVASPFEDLAEHPGKAMLKNLHRQEEKQGTGSVERAFQMSADVIRKAWSKPIPKEQLKPV